MTIARLEDSAAAAGAMAGQKSTLVSRNITVLGKRTSVRLEPEMWASLKDIARREGCKIHDICSLIQMRKNPKTSLTAAIRVFLMLYYRAAATEEGHGRAGHGDFNNMMQRARMTRAMLAGAHHKNDDCKGNDYKSDDYDDGRIAVAVPRPMVARGPAATPGNPGAHDLPARAAAIRARRVERHAAQTV